MATEPWHSVYLTRPGHMPLLTPATTPDAARAYERQASGRLTSCIAMCAASHAGSNRIRVGGGVAVASRAWVLRMLKSHGCRRRPGSRCTRYSPPARSVPLRRPSPVEHGQASSPSRRIDLSAGPRWQAALAVRLLRRQGSSPYQPLPVHAVMVLEGCGIAALGMHRNGAVILQQLCLRFADRQMRPW